jgi:prepilin-type N-terminal cleavage/methylation domain-containing protein/prepilin-type processing-associated H-X9-DG protein
MKIIFPPALSEFARLQQATSRRRHCFNYVDVGCVKSAQTHHEVPDGGVSSSRFAGTRHTLHGFTLVELLVVIAIIGVLVAMTLPAIQASRETARRSQCIRNLTQLGNGLQNYEMAHEVFPPGVVDKQRPIHSVAQGDHRNWIIHILPYIDELNTYRHIDQAVGVYDPKNAEVRNTPVALLNCPSEPGAVQPPPQSNYAAVHHDVEAPIDVDNHGVSFLNSRVKPDDITDGLSHTLFVGEKLSDPLDLGWMSGTRATLRNTGSPLNTPLPAVITGASPGGNSAAPPQAKSEESPPAANAAAVSLVPTMPADPTLFVGGFASYHPAGVNFAFGDGSVRFLTDTINLQVLQQLAHRSDGKLLPAVY